MFYLQNDKTGQYVASIIKLNGENAYAVYFKDKPDSAGWASEKGAQAALGRLLDCEYTNPRGAALDLVIVDPDAGQALASPQTAAPARTLPEIEADILAQKRTIGMSIVIIGRALIEAKEQIPHGAWSAWLEERVNFSQSTADNYMRIAQQIGSGSPLLDLPYTKILALLSVPAEEREQFAADNDVGEKSVSEVKRLIRERDEAKAYAESQRAQYLKETERADKLAKEAQAAKAKAAAERRDQERLTVMLNKERENVAQLMAREPDTVTIEKEVPPSDYELIKNQLKNTRELLAETEDELAQAHVERDMAMQELEAGKLSAGDPLDVTPFRDACSALLNRLFAAPVADGLFRTKTDLELEQYASSVATVMEWAVKTQDAIEKIRAERRGDNGGFVFEL